MSSALEVAGLTDTGQVREHNEDAIHTDGELGLLVVADGMGGYKAGEIASAIAVENIRRMMEEGLPRLERNHTDPDSGFTLASMLLHEAVVEANAAIFRAASEDTRYQGMGTTLVACLYHGDRLSIAHVGDSRMYRLRGGEMQLLTSDHSLLQELVDRGFYTSEEAEKSLNRNIVTRAMGVEEEVEVDLQEESVAPGDILLLCSDGLNDMLDEQTIRLTLNKFGDNLGDTATELVQAANQAGGRDNISVVLGRISDSPGDRQRWLDRFVDFFS